MLLIYPLTFFLSRNMNQNLTLIAQPTIPTLGAIYDGDDLREVSQADTCYINHLAYVGGSLSFRASAGLQVLLLAGVHAHHVIVVYLRLTSFHNE